MNRVSLPADIKNDPFIRYKPVCSVVAAAVCMGISFKAAWDIFEKTQKPNWNGPLYDFEYVRVIREYGVTLKELSYAHRKNFVDHAISKFIAHTGLADPDSVYLVTTRSHVQVVHNGMVTDQGGTRPVNQYIHRRRRILRIWEVDNPNMKFEEIGNVVKECETMDTEKKLSKAKRAHQIYLRESVQGKKRKEILAIIAGELDTTWGAASTFYHLAKKSEEAKSVTTE